MIKVVNQNVEVWTQKGYSLNDIYEHIARCARVCYQSTPRNNEETSYDFLKRTILRGKDIKDITKEDIPKLHLSVFEHGIVYLKIPFSDTRGNIKNKVVDIRRSKYSNYFITGDDDCNNYCYIITNMRVIIENNAFDVLEYLADISDSFNNKYKRVTLSITTDIGCSRELNRHRNHSVSEESTRYCRYTANKFGNNITIAKLPWIDYKTDDNDLTVTGYKNGFYEDDEIYNEQIYSIQPKITGMWNAVDWFLYGVQIANLVYSKCIELGWTAQQAREILPLNTKTQLVHTASIDDWNKFIDLRANEVSGKVHPMMKELALMIKDVLK